MTDAPEPFAWNFCPICGGKLTLNDDGEQPRPHCALCRRFYYSNPIPAACCLVDCGDAVLFVQRAIEPCLGEWALPGGFVELHETTEEAALRELQEETGLVGRGAQLIGAATQRSREKGAVTVLGYRISSWEGKLRAGSDALETRFFATCERPPLAFEAHRMLVEIYDRMRGPGGPHESDAESGA